MTSPIYFRVDDGPIAHVASQRVLVIMSACVFYILPYEGQASNVLDCRLDAETRIQHLREVCGMCAWLMTACAHKLRKTVRHVQALLCIASRMSTSQNMKQHRDKSKPCTCPCPFAEVFGFDAAS